MMSFLHRLRCRALFHFAALLGFSVAETAAQDVTISPLQWTDPHDAPDDIPVLQGDPRLVFPEALRPTPDINYLVITFILDADAKKLGSQRATTTPALIRVYEQSFTQFKFAPARREGKPVNSAITLALLFNPASADPKNPDATPRLLEVGTVKIPRPKEAGPTENIEDVVVFADISIDETGRVTAVKNAPVALQRRFENAVKNWRFTPARRGGQPVASEMRAPFVIETEGALPPRTGKATAPRVTSQVGPVYPLAMRQSGMRGEVIVDFVVDIEGRVRNAYVLRTLNPAFDDPALEAVRKWKFVPGRVGDLPVNTHMQVPIIFELTGEPGGGEDGLRVRRRGDMAKLPEELRYDTAPRPVGTVRPVYPHALLTTRRRGRATVRYLVDENGKVALATVQETTAPEFGHALLAAVEQFTYEPALKGGRPNKALMSFSQEFTTDEAYQLVSSDDLRLLQLEKKASPRIASAGDLDEKLTLLSQRPPHFPRSRMAEGKPGEALVEFLVDEEGRARLPRIVTATDDVFGYAALQSTASWRFEPPKRGGKSVIARVRAPISFKLADGTIEAGEK